ncbi:MAG: aromatic amino acid lyase, partial [Pseudomonadota bacterium]
MKLISAFLASLESGKAGKALRAALPAIDQRYEHFLRYEAEFGGMIYGTNTLPGHRDGDLLDHVDHGAYQLELIRKHCIGGAPYFGSDVARAVTLAKVYSCLEPGVTLSGALVGAALDAFEAEDFQPQIPRNSSYSSGDVIPAAHWSAALLDWQAKRSSYVLRPGEGMALINGAFAHVGATAALCSRIKTFWPLLLEAQRISLTVMGADRRAFRVMGAPEASWGAASNAYVSADLEDHTSARQDPVSTRSVVQCLGALTAAIDVLFSACDASLSKPSGNPLFFEEPMRGHAPNGSFLDPALTIFTGAVIEALLMTGWASVQRINHMLSGKNEPIPMDAATPDDPMGLIQWPKNAQAKLEKMRRACGTRAFV